MTKLLALAAFLLLPSALASAPDQQPPKPKPEPQAGKPESSKLQKPTSAEAFFGLGKIWDVHLQVGPEDWRKLYPTGRAFGVNMLGRYSYVKAQVDIAGHRVKDIGLRFKGNSTYMFTRGTLKRPFKIDFDRYVKQQTFLGLKKLNLNNNATDGTQIREAVSYRAYREAGVPASRTAFLRVFLTVKDKCEREYLGMYTAIEQVDRRLLKRTLSKNPGLLVKPERRILPFYGEEWNERYEKDYIPKTKVEPATAAALIGLAKLLTNDDEKEFQQKVGTFLDLPAFYRYVGVSVILCNLDSPLNLAHNYYLAVPGDTRRVVWIPWDLNLSLSGFTLAGSRQAELSIMQPSRLPLLNRVLDIPECEKAYRAEVKRLIEGPCSARRLLQGIALARKTTAKAIAEEEGRSAKVMEAEDDPGGGRSFFGGRRGRGAMNRMFRGQRLEDFARDREASVIAQLKGESQGRRGGMSWGFGNRDRNNRNNRNRNNFGFGRGAATDASGRLKQILAAQGALKMAQAEGLDKTAVQSAAATCFEKLDADGSKGLDRQEVAQGLAAAETGRRSRSMASFRARRVMRELDADKDGSLSKEEWAKGVQKGFESWDRNKDGKLDHRESAVGGRRQ